MLVVAASRNVIKPVRCLTESPRSGSTKFSAKRLCDELVQYNY